MAIFEAERPGGREGGGRRTLLGPVTTVVRRAGARTDLVIASHVSHLLAEPPKIDRFMVNGGHVDASAAQLSMEQVKLFQEVQVRPGRGFHRVQTLYTGLEPEFLMRTRENTPSGL